ncbi:allophanate hydrolase subunit 1 [Epibacterium sp. MM17-32]|uniref:5-oxoprolinase subunit B family protein n=1 Tax=Epibacterium sp. MM17-32 TaxID=2917734 RepID=UPI001EF66DB5|nr:carboxyltransferase domain-containing protein [Epibacterium sp. MM17-32]MCG7626805.1 allophanate hydrolase subunit 1 [Epibacterium sp. MM17-32]
MAETRSDMQERFPKIRTVGVDGMLVSFGARLSEAANRAALAFRAALATESWEGIEEVSTSLVSTYLRFDTVHLDHATLRSRLEQLLRTRDWYGADLPGKRRLWRIPAVFGTELAPQLPQAAAATGLSEEEAVASLTGARVRVQTIGFAPGQPYLGELPEAWDIPRQSQLTSRIPEGALAVAIRQLVLFSVSTPTGWMHVGQTAVRLFRPEADEPFLLRPGDEVQFAAIKAEQLEALRRDPLGGASAEALE